MMGFSHNVSLLMFQLYIDDLNCMIKGLTKKCKQILNLGNLTITINTVEMWLMDFNCLMITDLRYTYDMVAMKSPN